MQARFLWLRLFFCFAKVKMFKSQNVKGPGILSLKIRGFLCFNRRKIFRRFLKKLLTKHYYSSKIISEERRKPKTKGDNNMKQFEVGKTYYTRSACNHDCVFRFTITKRTAKTVTFTDGCNKEYRRKINISTWYNEPQETIHPYGLYSMSPVITASDDFVRA